MKAENQLMFESFINICFQHENVQFLIEIFQFSMEFQWELFFVKTIRSKTSFSKAFWIQKIRYDLRKHKNFLIFIS